MARGFAIARENARKSYFPAGELVDRRSLSRKLVRRERKPALLARRFGDPSKAHERVAIIRDRLASRLSPIAVRVDLNRLAIGGVSVGYEELVPTGSRD